MSSVGGTTGGSQTVSVSTPSGGYSASTGTSNGGHHDAGEVLEEHEQQWQKENEQILSDPKAFLQTYGAAAGTGQASGLSVPGEENTSSHTGHTGGSTGA